MSRVVVEDSHGFIMLFSDKWFFVNVTATVFKDYYATIPVDLSSPYCNWKKWVQT